jgi:hypothetical protein
VRTRNIAIGVGVVLALGAGTVVLLYAQGQKVVDGGGELVAVIVPKRQIPANKLLDPLISRGVFIEIEIPAGALEEGAVTDVRELDGATTTAVIRRHELILTSELTLPRLES